MRMERSFTRTMALGKYSILEIVTILFEGVMLLMVSIHRVVGAVAMGIIEGEKGEVELLPRVNGRFQDWSTLRNVSFMGKEDWIS